MPASAGFDIAKDFHWLAVLDDRGQPVLDHRVDNAPAAIDAAADELLAAADRYDGITIGLDVMGGIAGLLTAMLVGHGLRCVHVSGLTVNRARHGTRGGENKSDPRDARVIAEQVMFRTNLRPVPLSRESDAEMRLLVSHRAALVKEITAHTNRLHDLLAGIHPGLDRAMDSTNKSGLILLCRYVTPTEIRRSGSTRIAGHLRKHGVRPDRSRLLAEAAVASAQAQHTVIPGEQRAATL
ncbi:IS110 family transposase, partial [Streptomyces rimosus]